ncbi:hypothetical protein CVT24_003063 [Panaeolus cyanescens]|uniref:Kinetochore protein NDC80 n=1 Tax=Panaeolus cyanescens TaxID=181874 RepID=A0A409VFS4_9AGAR|nr:hypothetical protein CVT24_003063 [Panaeolus cyanescens]
MDARRRSVMHPTQDSMNQRSGIPMPSTIHKPAPSFNSRMSLAGPAMRAPNPPVPSSNPRQSMMRSQNVNPLLQSVSKPSAYGRTPMSNSVRRGSIWAGNATLGAPSSSQAVKDNRPLRDKAYQAKMRQDIQAYLPNDITTQSLLNMTGADYRRIFDILIRILDPEHPFPERYRLEEEMIPTLKALRYPYAHQIDQKWLAAVASPHSWPYLLGVLHWLVELCKMRDDYMYSRHPSIQNPYDIDEEFDHPLDHKALAFKYHEDTYTMWLDLKDDFTECNVEMEQRYSKRNERVQLELNEQAVKLNQAKIEYNNLKSTAPSTSDLEKQNQVLIKDKEKLQKILERYEQRRDKVTEQIAFEKSELVKAEELLESLKAELATLTDTVKSQNLTPEEVMRMNTDRETLTRNLEDLKQKIAESHRHVMNLEVNVTNRAAAAEEALDTYTNMLSDLELFPSPPEPWQDIDLTLELNTAASNPQQLLTGSDIRKIIKPTLGNVAESKRVERAAVESERIKIDNDLDQITTECENLDDEIAEVQKKATHLNDEADNLREATQQEALMANAEAASLERELANARTAAITSGLGVKSELHAVQFSYKEQIEKVARLKDDTVRAILKNSQEIATFKQEVSRHLQELRDFASSD